MDINSVPINNNNKRIAKNTFFLYGRLIIVMLVSLYTVRIVLNALGVEDYGVYNVVAGFVSMFGFLNTTLAHATQRFYNYEMGQNGLSSINYVFHTSRRIQLILSIIIFVLCELIGVWYVNTKMVIPDGRLISANFLFQFSLISLFIIINQVPFSAAIISFERMNFYALLGILDTILKLIIAILIMYVVSSEKLIIYGFLILIISFVNYFLVFVYCKRNFPQIFTSVDKSYKSLAKEMISFSGWNVLGTFSYMIRDQGVNVLMNYYFGAIINAANGVASQVSGAFQQFSTNLVLAFKPQLTQSYARSEYDRTKSLFFMMSKIALILIFTISFPFMLEMPNVLHLWLGNDVPKYASSFAIYSIIISIIGTLHMTITQVIHATGKLKIFQIIDSLIVVMILPISWLFLHYGYDPNFVYVISVIFYIIKLFVSPIILNKYFEFGIKDYLVEVILPSIFSILIIGSVPFIINNLNIQWLLRFFLEFASIIILSVFTTFTFVLNKLQKKEVLKYISKKLI